MVQCSFPLFLEAIKRPSLSQLAIMNVGQYIFQSEISTTILVVLIETVSYSLVSMQFQKVCFNASTPVSEVLIFFSAEKQHAKCSKFRKVRRQLVHSTLAMILQSLKPGMTKAEVVRCADDHFRQAIYEIGPYIADYPEQCLLTCIVQGWCPK